MTRVSETWKLYNLCYPWLLLDETVPVLIRISSMLKLLLEISKNPQQEYKNPKLYPHT